MWEPEGSGTGEKQRIAQRTVEICLLHLPMSPTMAGGQSRLTLVPDGVLRCGAPCRALLLCSSRARAARYRHLCLIGGSLAGLPDWWLAELLFGGLLPETQGDGEVTWGCKAVPPPPVPANTAVPLPWEPPDAVVLTLTEEPLEADGGSVPCLAILGKSCPGLGLSRHLSGRGRAHPLCPLPHGRVSTPIVYKVKDPADPVY